MCRRCRKRMRVTNKMCAYCGASDTPLQTEHPVAKAFWNGPRPSRTVTVPACADCDGRFQAEESFFRNTVVALAGDAHPEAKLLLEGKMQRGLARNQRELADITRGVQHGFRRKVGSAVLEPASRFELDIPRLNRCLEKVVRGLFFFTRQRPLSITHKVVVSIGNSFWTDASTKPIIAAMGPFGGYGDGDTV